MRPVRRFLLKAFRRRRLQGDLASELEFHREMAALHGGRIPFGNPTAVKELALDLWRFNWIENLGRDILFGLRRLRKSSTYAIAAFLSLSLGIGITAGVFTLLNAVVFRPLPYAHESRLVWFTEVLKANSTDEITITPDFLDWQRLNHSFENIAAMNDQTSVVTGLGRSIEVHGARTSATLLRILEVQLFLGRDFTRAEDVAGGAHVIIVSHAFWHEYLHANKSALGKPIRLDAELYTLVGVLPQGFVFPSTSDKQFIVPLAKNEAAELARDGRVLTVVHGVVGRLKPNVTIAEAHAEITAIQSHLPIPPFHPTITIKMLPLREFLLGDQKLTASVFVIGAFLFLLVASANLGNLTLSQLMYRERELAVRRALGASRARVIAQLLIESIILSVLASFAGFFFAWGIRNLLASVPSYAAAIYARLPFDFHVALFTTCLLALVVVLFGLIPAVRISDVQLASAIRESQLTSSGRRHHLRFLSFIASAEIAVVVSMASIATLMVISFHNLRYRNLGIQTEHVTAGTLHLSASKYKDLNHEFKFLHELLARSEVSPGVEAAALSVATEIPPGAWHASNTARIEGRPLAVSSRQKALTRNQVVSAGYFKVLGIALLDGRLILDSDGRSAPPIVVVSEEFARRYFRGQNPIGHRLKASDTNDAVWYSIVGVVSNVKSSGLASAPEPVIYVPFEQSTGVFLRELGILLRSSLPTSAVAQALRSNVASLDPELPVSAIQTIDERLNDSVARPRFTAGLLVILSVLGALFAVVGVYGLVSCRVRTQMREFAIRQALGAPTFLLVGQIISSAAQMTASGMIFGSAITLAATRILSALLFQVSPSEPLVLICVCTVVLLACLTACLAPAWKATQSDPLVILRET